MAPSVDGQQTASNQSLGPVPASASSARGFNVVLWRSGELGYALVSDVSLADLVGLATSFAPTTVR
jgi:anti-sigma factor RsiW